MNVFVSSYILLLFHLHSSINSNLIFLFDSKNVFYNPTILKLHKKYRYYGKFEENQGFIKYFFTNNAFESEYSSNTNHEDIYYYKYLKETNIMYNGDLKIQFHFIESYLSNNLIKMPIYIGNIITQKNFLIFLDLCNHEVYNSKKRFNIDTIRQVLSLFEYLIPVYDSDFQKICKIIMISRIDFHLNDRNGFDIESFELLETTKFIFLKTFIEILNTHGLFVEINQNFILIDGAKHENLLHNRSRLSLKYNLNELIITRNAILSHFLFQKDSSKDFLRFLSRSINFCGFKKFSLIESYSDKVSSRIIENNMMLTEYICQNNVSDLYGLSNMFKHFEKHFLPNKITDLKIMNDNISVNILKIILKFKYLVSLELKFFACKKLNTFIRKIPSSLIYLTKLRIESIDSEYIAAKNVFELMLQEIYLIGYFFHSSLNFTGISLQRNTIEFLNVSKNQISYNFFIFIEGLEKLIDLDISYCIFYDFMPGFRSLINLKRLNISGLKKNHIYKILNYKLPNLEEIIIYDAEFLKIYLLSLIKNKNHLKIKRIEIDSSLCFWLDIFPFYLFPALDSLLVYNCRFFHKILFGCNYLRLSESLLYFVVSDATLYKSDIILLHTLTNLISLSIAKCNVYRFSNILLSNLSWKAKIENLDLSLTKIDVEVIKDIEQFKNLKTLGITLYPKEMFVFQDIIIKDFKNRKIVEIIFMKGVITSKLIQLIRNIENIKSFYTINSIIFYHF
ncbi:hypothetical protein CWI39_0339p0030 [Hamiltosporidium magnivora]|uniref:Uncharacterized protein n=1 Tax=Hamiltosporidium magnivora TaxID=148818 RepID=A0A4Q9LGY0_9MICR|nr:hypothetical protein CWI39_0339p0030 [Hamiltosporidium magnivora]